MYDFGTVQNRCNSGSVKWDTGRRIYSGTEDFIPMWIADTDFPTLPQIPQAIARRLEHPLFGYCTEPPAFFTSIAGWIARRHGWNVQPQWVSQAEGVVNAIALAINAFTEPGDPIIVQTPCYDNFYKVIQQNQRTLLPNPLRFENGRFSIDLEGLEAALKSGARVLLFCNPHNPTGRVWTTGELQAVAQLCVQYDALVISDDIHCDVVRPDAIYTPLAAVHPDMPRRTITCYAPGKTFNTAALKAAAVVIPNEERMQAFKDWQQRMFLPKLNVLSYETAIAAYTYGDAYADELSAYIAGNADFTLDFLAKHVPQIRPVPIEGTYLMPWDCSALGLSGRDLVMFFAREADVAFSSGTSYSPDWAQWVRVNLACSRAVLTRALERVAQAVRSRGEAGR